MRCTNNGTSETGLLRIPTFIGGFIAGLVLGAFMNIVALIVTYGLLVTLRVRAQHTRFATGSIIGACAGVIFNTLLIGGMIKII